MAYTRFDNNSLEVDANCTRKISNKYNFDYQESLLFSQINIRAWMYLGLQLIRQNALIPDIYLNISKYIIGLHPENIESFLERFTFLHYKTAVKNELTKHLSWLRLFETNKQQRIVEKIEMIDQSHNMNTLNIKLMRNSEKFPEKEIFEKAITDSAYRYKF